MLSALISGQFIISVIPRLIRDRCIDQTDERKKQFRANEMESFQLIKSSCCLLPGFKHKISLVSGRNPVLRTRSFTKEEIEEFWKRKQLEEEGSVGSGGGGGSKKDHHHQKKQAMASSHIVCVP
jgi:hypothetical protein